MRARLSVACLFCLTLSACSDNVTPASTEVVVGSIAMPEAILTTRAIERQRLKPTATVGTTSFPLVPRGDRYAEIFSLPDEADFELTVYWDYELDDPDNLLPDPDNLLPLARTVTRLINLSTGREILVDADDYIVDFDEDKDGMNNIDELAVGRDPLVRESGDDLPGMQLKAAALATLRDDQADCRLTHLTFDGQPGPDTKVDRDIYLPILGASTVHAPELVRDQRVYRAQVAVTEAGTLSIDALGGEPGPVQLWLHDRKAETRGETDLDWISVRSNDGHLDVELRTGLYCLAIQDARGDDPGEWRELSDLVLSFALMPHLTNQ